LGPTGDRDNSSAKSSKETVAWSFHIIWVFPLPSVVIKEDSELERVPTFADAILHQLIDNAYRPVQTDLGFSQLVTCYARYHRAPKPVASCHRRWSVNPSLRSAIDFSNATVPFHVIFCVPKNENRLGLLGKVSS
jgi:hypothetical protein